MNAIQARVMWRRATAARTREERTITAYLQKKHPEIYAEASAFYNHLNKLYPTKGDLRKVPEFKTLSWGKHGKLSKYVKTEYPNIPVSKTTEFRDNLQLEIELLPLEETPTTSTQLVENPVPEPAQFCVLEEGTATMPDTTTSSDPVQIGEEIINTLSDPIQIGEIDEEIINQIIADLQKDPDIQNIFDDILDVDEVTPLEAELLMW